MASNTTTSSMTARVEALLNGIIDPCSVAAGIPGGLIDMGLVRELRVTVRLDGHCDVDIKICTTDPRCMMAAVFLNEVKQQVSALIAPGLLEVQLDHHTMWTPAMMAPHYSARLAERRERRAEIAGTDCNDAA